VEFVGLRVVHLYRLPAPPVERIDASHSRRSGPVGVRRAFFGDAGGYVDTPVYDRLSLSTGVTVAGPAILDQDDTTTIVYPGQVARIHDSNSIIVTRAHRVRETT